MQLSSAVVLGVFMIPPAALALVVSPRAHPVTQAVEEPTMSLSQAKELKREIQEEEKLLFGHSVEDKTLSESYAATPEEIDADEKEMKAWVDMMSKSSARRQAAANKTFMMEQPATCPFSNGRATFYPSTGTEARFSYSFISTLNSRGLNPVLGSGTLLGAYRHHGVIPFDMDLDAGLLVCDSSKPKVVGAGYKWSCEEAARLRRMLGNVGFHNKVWQEWMAPKLRGTNVKLVKSLNVGLRLSNGLPVWDGGLYGGHGIGMDLYLIDTGYVSGIHGGDVCKCKFGNIYALCPRDSAAMLKEHYGPTYMTPKSQCQHYCETGHCDWNHRSASQCRWATTIKRPIIPGPPKNRKKGPFDWVFHDP